MYSRDPVILERHSEIRRQLSMTNKSISEVAESVGLSRKRVYAYAKRVGLPYNRPIKHGGSKEQRILAAKGSGYDVETIGSMFSMSPVYFRMIIEYASRNGTQVGHSPGH